MLHLITGIITFNVLNVFKYITFRSICAIFTSLAVSFLLGPVFIKSLKKIQYSGQPIRSDGPESHLVTKKGTPTMGGILILFSILISTILLTDLNNPYIWIVLFIMISFALIGFIDDYQKLKHNSSKGISGRTKLFWQFLFALIASTLISKIANPETATTLFFPFFKDCKIDLGLAYLLFNSLVIVGSSNAVNLTDGLDGLATGPIIIAASCFALISYLTGNVIFANYLQIHYVQKAGELVVLCSALIGAGLGFLWYNAPPAKVFMGDIGSLALGAMLGVVSVITKHEIVLFLTGGLFVIEAISVIIQVIFFKTRGRRIFKMAPVHHHFEKLGWSESTIVIRFWIIAIIFALIGLSTLKLR